MEAELSLASLDEMRCSETEVRKLTCLIYM
jgi:hypothetical protein